MFIDNPKFPHRKIVNGVIPSQYSPKKRWDEGSYGEQKQKLYNHVSNVLLSQQKDNQILQKFRKQAQLNKINRRKQKFPHLFKSSTPYDKIQNQLKIQSKINNRSQRRQSELNLKQTDSIIIQKPQYLSEMRRQQTNYINPQNNLYTDRQRNLSQFQTRLQYQRNLAKKDMEIFKKNEKIKRQNRQIKQLQHRLSKVSKQQQIDKIIAQKQQLNVLTHMLSDIKQQLSSRKAILSHYQPIDAYKSQKPSKIQPKVENNEKISIQRSCRLKTQSQQNQYQQKNMQVKYSPQIKKNKSSVFVNATNNQILKSFNGYLDELKTYNNRLERVKGKRNQY